MNWLRVIRNAAVAVIAFLVLYVSNLQKLFGPDVDAFVHLRVQVSIIVLLLIVGFLVSMMLQVYTQDREQRDAMKAKISVLEEELRNFRDVIQTDVVTGIPNQRKFDIDLGTLSRKISIKQAYQLIMLDIEGFRRINRKFGYQKGDEVIRFIARDIFENMRRSEQAYKTDRPEMKLWRTIYRKYTGGDEFLFILNGSESDALGFLLRLQRDFDGRFADRIAEILGERWPLAFHAGVCALSHGDTSRTSVERVQTCLTLATQPGSTSRVYWASQLREADFAPGSPEAARYRDVVQRFSKS